MKVRQILSITLPSTLLPSLELVSKGRAHVVNDAVLEEMQDRGWIDHRNNLTDKGREILKS